MARLGPGAPKARSGLPRDIGEVAFGQTPHEQGYRSRLVNTYAWFSLVGLLIATAYFVAWSLFHSSHLFVAGSVAFGASLGILTSRRYIIAGRHEIAAVVLAATLLMGGGLYTLVRPGSVASVAMIPLVVVALAMPLVQGKALRRLAVGAWATGVLLVGWNFFAVLPSDGQLWFTVAVRAAGYAAVSALVLVLLLAHDRRLRGLMSVVKEGEDTVRKANMNLLELDRAKTYFMNTASHELRTPMTPVLLQLRLLQGGMHGDLNARQRRSVDIVLRNVQRLNSITEELLDIARLQSGRVKLQLEDVDLQGILDEVLESFKPVAASKRIDLIFPMGPITQIRVDRKRIIQVLYNLLDNAMKFTPEGARIMVCRRLTDEQVEVQVADTGKGMEPEQVGRLFRPFTQVHGPELRTQPGTGLGLYICKEIVEAHGGRIRAESEGIGLGTTFSFTIPLAKVPAPLTPVQSTYDDILEPVPALPLPPDS